VDFEGIHKAFELSENETVVMAIALGYYDKNQNLYPRRPRRQFDDIASII